MKKILWVCLSIVSFSYADTTRADVTAISVTGEDTYRFAVTLKSDETGCKQFANWWEVLNAKGELLYRRILVHSHPDTQPFTRSGGKLSVKKDETLYVRAHMNNVGYVGDVFVGSVRKGFKKTTTIPDFPWSIENEKPLPTGCLY